MIDYVSFAIPVNIQAKFSIEPEKLPPSGFHAEFQWL